MEFHRSGKPIKDFRKDGLSYEGLLSVALAKS
jgi:hypothetical protein